MDRCTFITRFEALLQVDGEADIALAGMGDADQDYIRRKPAEARGDRTGPRSLRLRRAASACWRAKAGWGTRTRT